MALWKSLCLLTISVATSAGGAGEKGPEYIRKGWGRQPGGGMEGLCWGPRVFVPPPLSMWPPPPVYFPSRRAPESGEEGLFPGRGGLSPLFVGAGPRIGHSVDGASPPPWPPTHSPWGLTAQATIRHCSATTTEEPDPTCASAPVHKSQEEDEEDEPKEGTGTTEDSLIDSKAPKSPKKKKWWLKLFQNATEPDQFGVERESTPCAVGSLKEFLEPPTCPTTTEASAPEVPFAEDVFASPHVETCPPFLVDSTSPRCRSSRPPASTERAKTLLDYLLVGLTPASCPPPAPTTTPQPQCTEESDSFICSETQWPEEERLKVSSSTTSSTSPDPSSEERKKMLKLITELLQVIMKNSEVSTPLTTTTKREDLSFLSVMERSKSGGGGAPGGGGVMVCPFCRRLFPLLPTAKDAPMVPALSSVARLCKEARLRARSSSNASQSPALGRDLLPLIDLIKAPDRLLE